MSGALTAHSSVGVGAVVMSMPNWDEISTWIHTWLTAQGTSAFMGLGAAPEFLQQFGVLNACSPVEPANRFIDLLEHLNPKAQKALAQHFRTHVREPAQWQRVHKDAVAPSKAHYTDSGFDLTLIGFRPGDEGKRVPLYRTGVSVRPPAGYYFDLVPRSSLVKRGYRLANSVGIIDQSYRGEVFAPLEKVDPQAPDLEFPARVVQLILRPLYFSNFQEVEALSETVRGSGGFGSTGC